MTITRCQACGGPTVVLSGGEHIHANHLEHTEAIKALRDIKDELSNGVTANWDYIERRFTEGLGEISFDGAGEVMRRTMGTP